MGRSQCLFSRLVQILSKEKLSCDILSFFFLSQNLEAFWPGLLSMVGDNEAALKSLHNYHQANQSNIASNIYRLDAGLEAVRLHTRVLQCGARRGGCAEGGFPSQT